MDVLLRDRDLSLGQRMLIIWVFIACGLVIAFQLSQQYHVDPYSWAKLTSETR
jgi:hypothetical protein